MSIGLLLLIFLIIYLIITLIELKRLHDFKLRFYYSGFKIYKKVIPIQKSSWQNLDGIYEKQEAKYVFIPDLKTGYFVTHFDFYRHFNLFYSYVGIPLTVFGKYEEKDNHLIISYYISNRLVVLIGIWFLIWMVFPPISGELIGILIGIGGVLFTIFLIMVVFLFQKGKMLLILDEICKTLCIIQ